MKKVSIVVPVFNESSNIQPLLDALDSHLPNGYDYEIIFVDDGSVDDTLEVLQQSSFRGNAVGYLSFSRNFGHQNALKAGLDYANGNCVISMDGDLQHPPELIPTLLEKWEEGFDVVYTRRRDSGKQGGFKRRSSNWFYGLMRRISGLQMEEGVADFRLLTRQVVDTLGTFHEQD